MRSLGLLVALLGCLSQAADRLKDSFRDPPREYSMEPFWSWNSTLRPERLRWQMDQMLEKGIYGAYMHARDGLDQSATPYFSPGFWDAVRSAVEHAESIGFRTWIYDEDKWPSGAAGGRTIAANPDRFRARGLRHRSRSIMGPAEIKIDFTEAEFVIAARLRGPQQIDSRTLTDLTPLNRRPDGIWKAPAGEWLLSIFEPVRGREELPNYLNPEAVAEFIRNTYEQYAARFSRHFGKTIPGSFFDEIFNLQLAWDPLLEERFRSRKGYELRKVLPLLYLDGGPETIKVRCDYFEELTRLYEEAWFRQLSDWCGRHNLKLTGHTNEGLYSIRDQGDYFRTWRHPQIPGTDNEDFRYTFPRVIGSWKPKQLSSVAHVYGKPRAMAEALGGAGWPITLEEARYGVNMLSVYGINYFIFHLFHYAMDTPYSMDDWPNSWFYENPYWKYFKKLADYIRRVSFLGSQGRHVADVALLYPVEEVWSLGMKAPPPSPPAVEALVDRLVREPLDCDLVDTDSLIAAEASAAGGARIGTESYKVLILPRVETVSLAAYRRLAELAGKGLAVAAVGVLPRHSAENGADDPEVIRISQQLFAGRALRDADELVAWLRARFQPDLQILSGPPGVLRYWHRSAESREIYMLANSERRPASWRVRFRVRGQAERWDPETGTTEPVAGKPDSTLELSFQPWQAYYVVFGAAQPPRPAPRKESLPPFEIAGPWTLQLAPSELDYAWKPDPGLTRVEVPVAEFRFERAGGLPPWRRVKLSDALNPAKGAARYLSPWDAWWITRYVYRRHPGELGGPRLRFYKELELPFEVRSAWLSVVADGSFELELNGQPVGAGRPLAEAVFDKLPLRQGRNRLAIEVRGKGYLLAQGEACGPGGRCLLIRTDGDWSVGAPGEEPQAAYEFAFPPFGRWGDVPLRGGKMTLPAVVWYRVRIPPGARELDPPAVSGDWTLLVDDRPPAPTSQGRISLPATARQLQLQVRLRSPGDGLQGPLAFRCGPAQAELGDWQQLGLEWYSGRAVYRTQFRLPARYAGADLVLDLGELRYTGEVWINGRLLDTLLWPPYRVNVSRAVREGRNELVVVAANLLANQMRWNIFDSAVSNRVSRWWHDGNILREAEKLRSGLIGPVRIEASR